MDAKARSLVTLLLLLGACQGRPAETTPQQCQRSVARLEKVAAHPPACSADTDCEGGSHCDGGHCRWDCLSDSDCGAGNHCTCNGVCIAGTAAALSFPPTCQKDMDVLTDLDLSCATLPCPAGSFCDQQTAKCVLDCLTDDDCTGGRRCDCEGKCSMPVADGGAGSGGGGGGAGGSASPAPRNVVLDVSPLAFRLRPQRGAPIAPVAFQVSLSSPTPNPGAIDVRFVPAEVRAALPDGGVGGTPDGGSGDCVPPQVRCAPGAAFGADCHLTGPWSFTLDAASGLYVARATVEAQPAPTTVERTCGLELRSNETQNPLATMSLQLLPTEPVPVDGYYTGTVTLEEADGASAAYPAQGVLAGGRLALVDVARVVSDHPALLLEPPFAPRPVRWLRPIGGTGATSAVATLEPSPPAVDPASGRVTGTLGVTGPAGVHLSFRYTLAREAAMPLAACGPGVGCADPTTECSATVGRCLPRDEAVVASADFADPRRQAWTAPALGARPAYVASLPGTRQVEALLCHDAQKPGDYLGTDFISVGAGPASERTDAGELACAHSGSSQAFPFLAIDRPFETNLDGQDVFNLLASCVSELGQSPPAPDRMFGAAQCLSPGRFFAAMAQVGPAGDHLANRMLEVLLRGWLRAHATIGRIASLERQNADALSQQGQASQSPPLDQLLETLDRGWDLLLDGAVRERLLALPGSDVAEADYRALRNPIVYWSFNQMPAPAATVDVPDQSGNGHALHVTGTRSVWNGNAAHMCTTYPSCRHPSFGLAGRESQTVAPDPTVAGVIETELDCEPREGARKPICRRIQSYVYDGGVTCVTRAAQAKAALAYQDGVTAVVTGKDRRIVGSRFYETCHIRLDGVPVWNTGSGAVCGAPTSAPCETPSATSRDMIASMPGNPVVPVTCATSDSSRLTLEGDYTLFGEIFVVGTDGSQYLLRKADGSLVVTVERRTGDGAPSIDNVYVDIVANGGAVHYRIATQPGLYAFVHRDGLFRFFGTPPGASNGDLVELAAVQSAGPRIPVGTSASGRLELNCSRYVWLDDVAIFDRALEVADLQRLKAAHQRSVDLPFPLAPLTDSATAAYKVGLPVYVLEAAWRHLDLLERSLGASAGSLYAACVSGGNGAGRAAQLRRVGASLRRILGAERLAEALSSTVALAEQPWAPRYRTALAAVRAARSRLSFLARQIDRCDNPLGIAESDLPMYYQPAPGDAIGSFFGSSRYLTHEAEVQTQLAQTRLEAARTAAIEQRASRFQAKVNAAEHLRRVANLRHGFESTLQQLCGTPTGSPAGATPILDAILTPSGIDYSRLRQCFLDTTRTVCTTSSLPDVPPDCVRGKLGEQVLALQGAGLSASAARNSWERAQTVYEEYGRRCYEKSSRYAQDQRDLERFLDEVEKWRGLKLTADIVSTLAKASNGCTSLSDVIFSFGASCAAAIVGGAADVASLGFQEKINRVEADYQANKERRAHDEIVRDCFFEADQQKHTIEAQLDVLKEASHTILASQLELQNLRSQLEFTAVQAQAQLAIEDQLDVSIPQHHFWFDERIDSFRYSFEWARRLTYLAMRSAEYESQTTLPLRGMILSAQRPQELEDVQRTLRALNVPGQVGTNRVDYIPLVVSLRDQILRMVPEVDPTTHNVRKSVVQVFQEYLASSGTVVYSRGRRYGRGIRFSMRPFAATTTSCAERVWRVSASVQMDAEPLLGQDVLLYQANTFGSQLCGSEGQLQIARTRPERNLLMPAEDGSPTLVPLGGDASTTASIRIEALFNRTRRELLDLAPDAGNSGLAGRGLFSDYVLVIPDSAVRDGFDFSKMKDVLLRLQLVGTAAGGDIDP